MRIRCLKDYLNYVDDDRVHTNISAESAYFVIQVTKFEYRFLNDAGEPILYPKILFSVEDFVLPSGWQFVEDDFGFSLAPVLCSRPGFYEDFFCSDGSLAAAADAQSSLIEHLSSIRNEVGEISRSLIDRDLLRMRRRPGLLGP